MSGRSRASGNATPPLALADQTERDKITTALDATIVVEAAAGTGKTSELVRRIVAMLETGRASLDRLVAVTFTEAAAGELKLRLRVGIEDARLNASRPASSRQRLVEALPKLEEARIGTIHSFCADLLRERPVEAGVDPQFEVAAGDAARRLFDGAFASWFEGQLQNAGPGVRRILRRWKREPRWGRYRVDSGPRELLRNAAWQLVQQRHFPTPWRRDAGFERDATIDRLVEEMEALAALAADGDSSDWFTRSLLEIAKFVDEVRRAERVRERDHDALEARMTELVIGKQGKHWSWGAKFSKAFPPEIRARRETLHRDLQKFAADSGADLAPLLRDDLWPVVGAYEAAKEKTGCLDFDDLLIRARNLLTSNLEVRSELQGRFTHFFVDEFQDTDPLQTEILMLLAADEPSASDWRKARTVPGKLFLVGDPKQSIYRFRRADVVLYREVQERLVAQGATLVKLTVSFRSVPAIQDAVNAAFLDRLGGSSETGGEYVRLAPYRDPIPAQPAVIALPVPAPYGDYGKIVEWRIEESLPDLTAAWVDWVVRKSGWTVTERERPGERVPVEARHVCILFRRFRSFGDDMTRRYREALEARGLPHLLVGGTALHEREEIEVLRNALAAIERPDDELSVFATLRGPLLALSDAALLTWRERVGHLHPFRPVPEGLPPALSEVAQALAVIRDLHRGRNRQPVAHTISELLETTRAHAALAIWPNGMQALANVGRLLDLARRAEQEGLVSFRAFVERLEDDAETGEAAEGPMLEEGIEGVRIMTVHRAKGLEFPIVVLADMTAKETIEQPLRWTQPEKGLCVQRLAGCTPAELREHGAEELALDGEEAVRLLYVASTRARDILVVPVIGDERRESWLQALWPAVYPARLKARPTLAEEAPGCPPFGEDSVPLRPAGMDRPLGSVKPGLHVPETGDHRVVWWDPATLELGVRPANGLAQTRILEAGDEQVLFAAETTYAQWSAERRETRERGGKPTVDVAGATEWIQGRREIAGTENVAVVEMTGEGRRPKGRRFGTLVHALLSGVGLDDDAQAVQAHALVQSRLLGASEEEREAAAEAVSAALDHPLMRRAAAAAREGRCRRETPLVARLEDKTILESVVDLAFLEDGVWQVVDFKSDADLTPLLEGYRRQVALYAMGITDATGLPARGTILRV
ncbi:MAG TPA: UvrD-helicase domain-containing protein [Candidatus Binatia bacterium]|nr:UvrD-helicase domain-containing protein [Candidatus Binatia bacterium]